MTGQKKGLRELEDMEAMVETEGARALWALAAWGVCRSQCVCSWCTQTPFQVWYIPYIQGNYICSQPVGLSNAGRKEN